MSKLIRNESVYFLPLADLVFKLLDPSWKQAKYLALIDAGLKNSYQKALSSLGQHRRNP